MAEDRTTSSPTRRGFGYAFGAAVGFVAKAIAWLVGLGLLLTLWYVSSAAVDATLGNWINSHRAAFRDLGFAAMGGFTVWCLADIRRLLIILVDHGVKLRDRDPRYDD